MGYKRVSSKAHFEEHIQKAISSWKDNQFRSIRAAATHFQVPYSTVKARMAGRRTAAQARE
ncbi:hypothetical protein BJ878DRAFT_449135, partial [Calycina marina]